MNDVYSRALQEFNNYSEDEKENYLIIINKRKTFFESKIGYLTERENKILEQINLFLEALN